MSSDNGLVARAAGFISDNRRAVIITTAAVAAIAVAGGAAAYYASTSSPIVEKKDKKKSSKSGKKKKSVKDADGPILEERHPKEEETTDDPIQLPDNISLMSEEERSKLAASFKSKGNAAYQKRDFTAAVDLYTQAIAVSPKSEPVFYSNRAACYMNLSPPNYNLVVADCDEALKLDSNYVKALNRRATALEHMEQYEGALRDFTAATILERFTNQAAAQSVDRVLKKVSVDKAAELIAERGPRLPSHTFISAYFAAFRPRPHPILPEQPSQGDKTLILGLEALDAGSYEHAITLINEALKQGISFDVGKAEALNLRGTFKFLMIDIAGSMADFQESVKLVPSFTQSLVKLASVFMEQNNADRAFECFDDAIKQNPNDPDIYYHRGQVLFIMGRFKDAAENYTKSTELDPEFVFSHIQLAVAHYKEGNLANSMATFRRTLQQFPQRSEPQNYYGELLLDQQRFDDAMEKFDRAIELEQASKKTPANVLPLVNKALAVYQSKQDFASAERYCNEALRMDPECDAAVATLAQFSLQQGNYKEAAKYLAKQADLARTEPELVNALTYKYASQAQLQFLENYPEMKAQLGTIAQAS